MQQKAANRALARVAKAKGPSLPTSPTCHWIGRAYNKRPAAGQLATTGADGLAAAAIRKNWVIIGETINPAYSGTSEPRATARQPISISKGDYPILASAVAGLFAIVRIRCVIRVYGLN